MCDREDDKGAKQEPEEIGEETVRAKGFTKSQLSASWGAPQLTHREIGATAADSTR
jgi:hypothetical protein